MFFLDISIPSDKGYICNIKNFKESYITQPHWHGFVEMELVIAGEGVHIIDGTEIPIQRGDAWLLSIYDSHKVICNKGMQIINIAVNSDLLDRSLQGYISQNHPLYCCFSEEECHSNYASIQRLLKEQEQHYRFSKVKAISIINDLAVDIIRKSTIAEEKEASGLILDVVAWIQQHYTSPIPLSMTASEFGLTPNYLGYLFKASLGITYNDYLNSLRLKNACNLLLTSDLTVKEIAFDSGFHSVEYFNFIFKKRFCVTPTQYKTLAGIRKG